jgi:hypothetical protein
VKLQKMWGQLPKRGNSIWRVLMLEKTNAAVVFGRRELGGSHRRMRPVSFSAHLRGRLMSKRSNQLLQLRNCSAVFHRRWIAHRGPAAPSNESLRLGHDCGWLSPRGADRDVEIGLAELYRRTCSQC